MPAWPLITDFSKMLQNPKVAFRDTSLRTCTVEKNNLGQPKARSGNFATVYRGYREDGSEFAIRIFNRLESERRDRYVKVSEYLKDRSVASIVGFEYDEKGIRSASDGKLYPLVTMDWVPGVTLFEWARDRCREDFKEALSIGADVWLQLVRHLTENGIVHGDLQHGNILVSAEGYFKLVDYDCLSVPDLMGLKNVEIGMVPYQHPARDAETQLFPGLDNFSALVIYVALRALSATPNLWHTYVDSTGYDKLLFRKEDFADPSSSRLYYDLMNSSDEQVRDLTHYLFQLTSYDIYQVPPIDEVLLWCNSLDQLLSARDWDTALQLVNRMGAGEQIPQHLAPGVDEAQRRVSCRLALEQALQRDDVEEIARCYVPELLDDYPAAAPLVEQAKQAAQVRQILQTMETAKQQKNWRLFVQTWQTNHALLANRPSAQPYREEMLCISRVENVRRLLANPKADDKTIIETWNALERAGGHPLAERHRAEVQRRIGRHGGLMNLRALIERAPATPTVDHDKQLAAACQEEMLKDLEPTGALRRHVEAAQQRLSSLEKFLEYSIQCSLEGEKAVAVSASQLPSAYHPMLSRRSQQARQRLQAYERLEESLQDPCSDLEIRESYQALEKVTGQKMVTDDWNWRIHLASERVPLIKALRLLKNTTRQEELDERILRIWKEALLNSCSDAQSWLPIYEQARWRRNVIDQLQGAVTREDAAAIDPLMADASLRDFNLPSELIASIEELKARTAQEHTAKRQGIIGAIMDSNLSVFFDLFDAALVREIGEEMPHHQLILGRWTEAEVLPLDRCGLAPFSEGNFEQVDTTHHRVRWTWPTANITNRCLLVISHEKAEAHTNPETMPALYRETIDRTVFDAEQPGKIVEVAEEWKNCNVIAWAKIDLGFQVFYSAPLDLGQLQTGKKRRWGLFG